MSIEDPQAIALASEASAIKTRAVSVLVRSPREYEIAAENRRQIKAKHKEIEGHRVHMKAPALEQCRRIDEFFRGPLNLLKEADNAIARAMLTYQEEERRAAAAEQRRRDEEARKQREALEAKARAEREAADRRAAQLRQQEQEARAKGDLSTAVTLRHEADQVVEQSEEKAQEIEHHATAVVPEKVVAEVPVVQGVHTRTIWRAKIVDPRALPDEYKMPNEKMIQDFAKATKGKVPLPGVEFYPEQILAQRTA